MDIELQAKHYLILKHTLHQISHANSMSCVTNHMCVVGETNCRAVNCFIFPAQNKYTYYKAVKR